MSGGSQRRFRGGAYGPLDLPELLAGCSVALVDVDHTLTRVSTGRRLAQSARKSGIAAPRFFLSLPIYYLRYRLGAISHEELSRAALPIAGASRDQLEAIAEDAWKTRVQADVVWALVDGLRAAADAGTRIVLATASLELAVRPLASAIPATDVIASRLEFSGEIASGSLIGPPCYGPEKARRAADWAAEQGLTLQACAFLSDSIHDLPLLERCGWPIAVRPDRRLAAQARQRNWPVLHGTD